MSKPPPAAFLRPWHVLLSPVVPALALLSNNVTTMPPRVIVLPILMTLAGALVAWLVLALAARNIRTSALVVTILTVTVLSYSTVVRLAAVLQVPFALPVLYLVVLAGCVRILWRGGAAAEMTTFANLLLAALTVSFGVLVAWYEVSRPAVPAGVGVTASGAGQTDKPDIYVLILDGYGRADVLKNQYGFDNELVPALQSRGFSVAANATSNYAQTALSISSALNLDYVQTLLKDVDPGVRDRRLLGDLISGGRFFESLKTAGYRIRTYASEYPLIRPQLIDERLGPMLPVTEFDFALYQESAWPALSRWLGREDWLPLQLHRRHLLWTLDSLAQEPLRDDGAPQFVFAHLLMPHPPFVFNADGSERSTKLPIALYDGPEWRAAAHGSLETYERGYADAMHVLNARLVAIVDNILRRSKRPPIIYIQGDHGPGAKLTDEYSADSDLHERFGILLAVHLPGQGDVVSPELQPINGFRLLLNHAIGAGLPSLPGHSYFSNWQRPFDFVEVTDQVR